MGICELFLIGAGLSMDAFAASVCKGLAMKKVSCKKTLVIAGFFGGFQAIMPSVGYFLGVGFEKYITRFDHWIAFGLLSFIGGKMIFDVIFHGNDEEKISDGNTPFLKEVFILALATSIDALAVGISLAFLKINIALAASVIGITTFSISAGGVFIGNKFGKKYRNKASIAGGIILIAIGIKILVEHLSGG